MDLELSAEQQLLRDTIRRFLADSPTDAGLAELGVFGLLVAEKNGGSASSMVDAGVVAEELGRAILTSAFLDSAVGAATVIDHLDAAELCRSVAAGTTHATLAVYEPKRGYEWRRPGTVAGPGGSLTGHKTVVLGSGSTDVALVTACAPGGELGVWSVELAHPACTAVPLDTIDPSRPLVSLVLDGAPGNRLDAPGTDATAVMERALDASALLVAVDGIGAASRAVELATSYAQERHQFGRPIGSFQSVQHLIVDMLTDVELCRAGAYYALWASDQADPSERRRAVAVCKARAASALPRVGRAAIQVFGGIGFTWEHDIHRYLKRCLSAARLFGDERHHLDTIAALMVAPTGGG